MKMIRIAAACLTLALAATVHAQGYSLGWGQKPTPTQSGTSVQGTVKPSIVGGVKTADSTGTPLQFDANGRLYVTEGAPSANNYSFQPSVISGIFIPVNDAANVTGLRENRDSTSVIDCRGYNRGALLLFPSATTPTDAGGGSADSLGAQVLAMEVRGHSGAVADSQSTFTWREDTRIPWSVAPAVPPAVDTLGGLNDAVKFYTESGNATGIRTRVLPTERAIVLSGIRNNDGTAAGVGTGTTRGRLIFLNKPAASGGLGLPPFLSVRLRSVATYISVRGGTAGLAATDSTKDLPMRLRGDLVLWRE